MNNPPCVFIVDDDIAVRDVLGLVIETAGIAFQAFGIAVRVECSHGRT